MAGAPFLNGATVSTQPAGARARQALPAVEVAFVEAALVAGERAAALGAA